MLGLLMLMIFLTSVFAGCGVKDTDSGNNDTDTNTEAGFAPYEYVKGNDVVGIDMDIAKAIADHLGKELVIKNMEFKGALMAVQNGSIDFVAAGVSVDEDRAEVMDFSDDYVSSTEAIVINKDIGEPLFEDKYAIAVQKGNTELLDEINIVIQKLKDEGKIEEFTANHTKK